MPIERLAAGTRSARARGRRRVRGHFGAPAAVTVALVLAACSEPGTAPVPPNPQRPTAPEAPVVVSALRPITVMPTDVRDPYGARVAALVHRGLMRYDVKGKAVPEVAESVQSDDDRVFVVKLRRAQAFSTGEPITAKTFVNSWNWVANPVNRQAGAEELAPIAGWQQVRSGRVASGRTPTLNGLRAIDDLTLRITLTRPTRDFAGRLGRLAFVPLPEAAMTDHARFAASPVGNGPYRLEGDWRRRPYLSLVKNPMYRGDDVPRNDGLLLRYVTDPSSSYRELRSGTLEVLEPIPLTALPTYRADLKLKAVNQPVGVTQSLAFPVRRAPWNTTSGLLLRRAISQAIDRNGLIERYFAQTRQRATDLAAPVVHGYSDGMCGELCTRDNRKARANLVAAGGFTGPLRIAYSRDSDDAAWLRALCDSITESLAIRCQPVPYPNQADYLTAIQSGAMTTPFVATTTMTTANLAGFLMPRFVAGSVFNDTGYAGPRVQALLAQGLRPDQDPLRPYLDAERQLLQDLPVIPLWTANATGGVGENIEGFKFDVFGQPVYTELSRP